MMDLGAVRYILIVLIDALAAVIWMYVLSLIDSNAVRKQYQAMVPIFFLGGLASAPLSLLFYGLNDFGYLYHEGDLAVILFYMIVVGLCEEGAKLVSFLIISSRKRTIKEPLDPIIQGASIGLGFGIMENFSYAVAYDIDLLVKRSIVTIIAHMTYTALSAYVFGASRYWPVAPSLKRCLPFTGLALAIIPHGIYDSLLYLNDNIWVAFSFNLVVLGVVVGLLNHTKKISPYRYFAPACWADALVAISAGLEYDPKNPFLAARRGWYHICAGRYDDAIVDFDRARLMGSKSPQVTVWRIVAELLGDHGAHGTYTIDSALSLLSDTQRKLLRRDVLHMLHGADREFILDVIDTGSSRTSSKASA